MTIHHLDPQHLPDPVPHNEGKTLAGWVTNGLIVLGALIAGVAMMIPQMVGVWVGAGVIVAGLIAGAVLRGLGHGQPLK